MLFNSYGFIFIYLPIVLLGFFWLARVGENFSAAWLACASLFFYGYWNPNYVALLLISIIGNYVFGRWIARTDSIIKKLGLNKKRVLICAITANLVLLAYYKYANFFVDSMNGVINLDWQIAQIVLPLGISFFTFTQIAFLVDTYQGKVKECNFIHYTWRFQAPSAKSAA